MIGKSLCEMNGLPESEMLRIRAVTRDSGLPLTDFWHDGSDQYRQKPYQELSSDKSFYRDKKVVLLSRDVKDTLVSAYFEATKKNIFDGSISEFIRSDLYGAKKMLTFYKHWYENREVPQDFLFIRYEEMHKDPKDVLTRVLNYLGVQEIDDEVLQLATSFSSFGKPKRPESGKKLKAPISAAENAKDPEGLKDRSGRVGVYTDYLSSEDIRYIDDLISELGNDFTRSQGPRAEPPGLSRNRELNVARRMKERNPVEPEQRPLGDNHTEGKAAEDTTLDKDPKQIVHHSVEHLHGPEEVPYGEDELVVVCLVRDGRPYVKSFVEHYRSLGVKHLFFLDNNSTDGTVEALKNYDNVTVLRTELPYKNPKGGLGGTETLFKQYLIGRFGKKDRWCLYADIDELFDYPYSDVVGLDSFLGYLIENSYTAVAAQMLDMFPEEPLSGREENLEDEPLKELLRFYDISNISRRSIKELHHLHNRNNTLESDEIEMFRDGIQNTIFGSKPLRTKFPLVFTDDRIKPFDRSSHWVDNANIADITCVLLHYKFLDGYLHKQAAQAVREGQYHNNSARYKRYLEVLDKNPTLKMKQETARELKGVNDLVENGFLVVSEEYMMRVYEEEEKRKGAGGHTAPSLGGERGGTEDKAAALYRARAQAKAQSLRANRLKRQLKELREQNQREVERLSRRLARFRKKNRTLMHQLQNIRASRSVRLLNKLGRIRARVLGRKG